MADRSSSMQFDVHAASLDGARLPSLDKTERSAMGNAHHDEENSRQRGPRDVPASKCFSPKPTEAGQKPTKSAGSGDGSRWQRDSPPPAPRSLQNMVSPPASRRSSYEMGPVSKPHDSIWARQMGLNAIQLSRVDSSTPFPGSGSVGQQTPSSPPKPTHEASKPCADAKPQSISSPMALQTLAIKSLSERRPNEGHTKPQGVNSTEKGLSTHQIEVSVDQTQAERRVRSRATSSINSLSGAHFVEAMDEQLSSSLNGLAGKEQGTALQLPSQTRKPFSRRDELKMISLPPLDTSDDRLSVTSERSHSSGVAPSGISSATSGRRTPKCHKCGEIEGTYSQLTKCSTCRRRYHTWCMDSSSSATQTSDGNADWLCRHCKSRSGSTKPTSASSTALLLPGSIEQTRVTCGLDTTKGNLQLSQAVKNSQYHQASPAPNGIGDPVQGQTLRRDSVKSPADVNPDQYAERGGFQTHLPRSPNTGQNRSLSSQPYADYLAGWNPQYDNGNGLSLPRPSVVPRSGHTVSSNGPAQTRDIRTEKESNESDVPVIVSPTRATSHSINTRDGVSQIHGLLHPPLSSTSAEVPSHQEYDPYLARNGILPLKLSKGFNFTGGVGPFSVLALLDNEPYIFIAKHYVPLLGTTVPHLKRRLKMYDWKDVRMDQTGYYIIFDASEGGQGEASRCYRNCHMKALFNYTMNMEYQPRGNPNRQSREKEHKTQPHGIQPMLVQTAAEITLAPPVKTTSFTNSNDRGNGRVGQITPNGEVAKVSSESLHMTPEATQTHSEHKDTLDQNSTTTSSSVTPIQIVYATSRASFGRCEMCLKSVFNTSICSTCRSVGAERSQNTNVWGTPSTSHSKFEMPKPALVSHELSHPRTIPQSPSAVPALNGIKRGYGKLGNHQADCAFMPTKRVRTEPVLARITETRQTRPSLAARKQSSVLPPLRVLPLSPKSTHSQSLDSDLHASRRGGQELQSEQCSTNEIIETTTAPPRCPGQHLTPVGIRSSPEDRSSRTTGRMDHIGLTTTKESFTQTTPGLLDVQTPVDSPNTAEELEAKIAELEQRLIQAELVKKDFASALESSELEKQRRRKEAIVQVRLEDKEANESAPLHQRQEARASEQDLQAERLVRGPTLRNHNIKPMFNNAADVLLENFRPQWQRQDGKESIAGPDDPHRQQLESQGVVFESDSDSDSWPEVPPSRPKPPLRDPFRLRSKNSLNLFEVAPEYLLDSSFFDYGAKKTEIRSRPRRKATFGKLLSSSRQERGFNAHDEISGNMSLGAILVPVPSGEEDIDHEGDAIMPDAERPEGERLQEVSLRDFFGLPDDPIPIMDSDGQLAYRDGVRHADGHLPRAKQIFKVGGIPGQLG